MERCIASELVAAKRRIARALGTPTPTGSLLALAFWWQSLTPTLIPRPWETQAATSAICLAIGYAIGTLAGKCAASLLRRHRSSVDAIRERAAMVIMTAWPLGVLGGAVWWTRSQNEQLDFMGMASVGWLDAALMCLLSLPAGALLVLIGRVLIYGLGAGQRFIGRRVPGIVAMPVTVLLVVVLLAVVGRGVAFRALTELINSVYAEINQETTEGTVPPDAPSVSGSRESLVGWDTLGRMGRDFVAHVTTAYELERFHGAGAVLVEPVRVYAGVRSAGSAMERANLAVRELERAGGFDRSVLVVWIPTGSGWMIPEAAAALEQLHRGDTAIVSVQYSFLPSLWSVFLDSGMATEAGNTLFAAVYARWSQLPPERRPKLVLFGKSLGTAGVEAPFVGRDAAQSLANLVAGIDGALIVGPKRSNPIHSQLTRERDLGSPVWQPVFDGGRSVRFLNRDPDRPPLDAGWTTPRIAYLQHPSDPVAFWTLDVLWRPPEWMRRPRGFDVPNGIRWFPIVSGVQALGDMLHQLGPPPGFGHVYSTDYARGWVSVVPPGGWSERDTERLERVIDDIAGGESEPQ